MAELEELALDPLVPPQVVLGGESLDEHGDRGRPSRAGAGDWRDAAWRPRAAARAARRFWRALNGRAGPASRRAGRRRGRAGAGTPMIIMPYGWSWPIAAVHRPSRLLAPHRQGSRGASRPREPNPGNSRDLSFVVLTN
jgi:hypothetical protein